MKSIYKGLNDYQMKFDDLLGDDEVFFNKDMGTPDSFRMREALLEHDEECDCLKCFDERTIRLR